MNLNSRVKGQWVFKGHPQKSHYFKMGMSGYMNFIELFSTLFEGRKLMVGN